MALWDGSSLNTDALAMNTNKWMDANLFPIVVKRNFLLFAMLGITGTEVPNWKNVLKTDYEINGNNLQIALEGSLETLSTLADANQTDAASATNTTTGHGAATFAWTHYSHLQTIRDSEYQLIRGDTVKTGNYMERTLRRLRHSWQKDIGIAINSTNDQDRTHLGGWEYAIDADGTYGTLTRVAENPDWEGNESAAVAGGGLDDLDNMKTDIQADGGNATIGVAGKAGWNKIKQEIRGYAAAVPSKYALYEGGGLVYYDGTTYGFESRCTQSVVGLFEPDALRFYLKGEAMETTAIPMDVCRATWKGISAAFAINFWAAFVSPMPSHCGKITGWV